MTNILQVFKEIQMVCINVQDNAEMCIRDSPNSILEEYIKSMSGKDGEKEKKALAYGIRALLESGEGVL